MSGVFKALSDPTRRQILQLLRDQDLTAGEIAAHFVISRRPSPATLSCCAARSWSHPKKGGSMWSIRSM